MFVDNQSGASVLLHPKIAQGIHRKKSSAGRARVIYIRVCFWYIQMERHSRDWQHATRLQISGKRGLICIWLSACSHLTVNK